MSALRRAGASRCTQAKGEFFAAFCLSLLLFRIERELNPYVHHHARGRRLASRQRAVHDHALDRRAGGRTEGPLRTRDCFGVSLSELLVPPLRLRPKGWV